jgi:hypothetical protein
LANFGTGTRTAWSNSVTSYCEQNIINNLLGTNTIKVQDLQAQVEVVGKALASETYMHGGTFTNRGVSDKMVNVMKNTLLLLKNIPNFCKANAFASRAHADSGENLMQMFDEISYNSVYKSAIVGTLTQLAENTPVVDDYTDDSVDDSEVVIDPETGRRTKKMKIKGKEGSTYTADDLTKPFVDVYPCFAGIATEAKDFKFVYILNPSSHKNIIDMSEGGGTTTTIDEKTFFKNDGTYYKTSDRDKISGNFKCSIGQEEILLTPTSSRVGKPESIIDKYPCLVTSNAKIMGTITDEAEMDDESRARHHQLSQYPEGKVFFFINGEFLTEFDEKEEKDMTGTFQCSGKRAGKSRLIVTPAAQGDWSGKSKAPEPKYRIPGPERPKNSMDGMGVVSISASYISEILKCAKIGGSTLNQDALNQLYDYIKNNKK